MRRMGRSWKEGSGEEDNSESESESSCSLDSLESRESLPTRVLITIWPVGGGEQISARLAAAPTRRTRPPPRTASIHSPSAPFKDASRPLERADRSRARNQYGEGRRRCGQADHR